MQRFTTAQRQGLHTGHHLTGMRPPRRWSRPLAATVSIAPRVRPAQENWELDEHWTAVVSYLADLHIPNEG